MICVWGNSLNLINIKNICYLYIQLSHWHVKEMRLPSSSQTGQARKKNWSQLSWNSRVNMFYNELFVSTSTLLLWEKNTSQIMVITTFLFPVVLWVMLATCCVLPSQCKLNVKKKKKQLLEQPSTMLSVFLLKSIFEWSNLDVSDCSRAHSDCQSSPKSVKELTFFCDRL